MKKIKLYDYQQEMLDNVIKVLTGPSLGGFFYNERGKRVKCANSVMVQMPTGTGKTYVMAAIVKWFLDTYPEGGGVAHCPSQGVGRADAADAGSLCLEICREG